MKNWDEVRTAFHVARLGTVSGAADALGVHHATVIRHVDALEGRLGVKLFQRHARGYTPTEAGEDLLRVATMTDDQFAQLENRVKGQGAGITGELVVTTLASLTPLMMPVMTDFQARNPGLIIRYLTGQRLFRLEYGEAHVAIRAGAAPDQPDNVVQPFFRLRPALCATTGYIESHGRPKDVADFSNHHFIGPDDADNRAPFNAWLLANVPRENVIFRTSDNLASSDAVFAGAGIGFLSRWEIEGRDDVVEVMGSLPEWESNLWLVTHVDLHRTPKVQAFLDHLKSAARDWHA